MIRYFDPPAGIERIVQQPAEADNLSPFLLNNGPRAKTRPAPLAMMTGDMPTAVAQRGKMIRMAHRLAIAEDVHQLVGV